ncbi:MAG TPA: UPF0182 family protein, partial [Ilumatobacteraceae bacterium]|nr:UPF0182 family protein [Ilumatobacteraceae bacterium]
YQLEASQFFERTNAWSVAQAPRATARAQSDASSTSTTSTTQPVDQQAADDAGSTTRRFVPYYTMFHEPGVAGQDGSFSILRPYVPYSKDDLLTDLQAFMVASSDVDTYGQLTAYVVRPTVDGPLKVANNAEADDRVRSEITLLNRSEDGSQVIFGDLQLVPVSNGLLYVRPLYVKVDRQTSYRRVIVSYNANAVIADSIGDALADLFPGFDLDIGDRAGRPTDGSSGTGNGTGTGSGSGTAQTAAELLADAQRLFDEADAALATSPPDYATFGAK